METKQNLNQEIPNIHSEHVKEEFYKWFESRGLLSDLRAYMRQLMVKALEESNKNGKSARQRKASTSPKLQAINLLVVDYLFHEEYLYTVSVFASEAQILESLPQYSCYVTQTVKDHRWDPSALPRFSRQETEDILDTLRLPPTQQEMQQATNLYLSGHESLLTCVVRTLATSHNQSFTQERVRSDSPNADGNADKDTVEYTHRLWSKEIEDLLLLAGVKLRHIKRMQEKWHQLIEDEKLKAKKEIENEHAAQKAMWEQMTEQKLRSELMEEMQAEQQLLKEQQIRVETKEHSLTRLAEKLTTIHSEINGRLIKVQLHSEKIKQRENYQERKNIELEERMSQLKIREEQLEYAVVSFQEQNEVATNQELNENQVLEENKQFESGKTNIETREIHVQVDIEEKLSDPGIAVYTQTLIPVAAVYTQTLETSDHEQQTSFISQPDPELLLQLHTDRERIDALQEENLELRAHALQQRHRIDELNNRAACLSSQLEESRITVSVLRGQESAVIATPRHSSIPTTPVVIAPTFGFSIPQRKGAGEESLFAPRPQQITPQPDVRKRPLRYVFSQNQTPTSEESSPTDEMIQNARARIQQLEEESADVQRNYQAFQNRLLTSDSVMFPPLGNRTRVHDPVMRVRRNDITFTSHLRAPYPSSILNNYRFQPIQTHMHDEDSSSDQGVFYERDRIENITNSRKIFTKRNIRQYERWKQFKKKFQRRDALDHHRQNFRMPNSNTSSDDDEGNVRNARRRQEITKVRKTCESQPTNNQIEHASNSVVKKIKDNKLEKNKVQIVPTDNICKQDDMSENLVVQNSPPSVAITKPSNSKTKLSSSNVDKKEDNKLILDLKRSEKLIESVKALLGAEKIINPATSTLSNESLLVESLPRDSDIFSQNGIMRTDNTSVLTVQSMNPRGHKESEDIINDTEDRTDSKDKLLTIKDGEGSNWVNNYSKSAIKDVTSIHSNNNHEYELDDDKDLDIQDNHPEPLTVPTLMLVSPAQDVASEDYIGTVAVTSTDAADQDSSDKGTTSVTSGSDIMRELNPSKTGSIKSVISVSWADDSKHSSDFWD